MWEQFGPDDSMIDAGVMALERTVLEAALGVYGKRVSIAIVKERLRWSDELWSLVLARAAGQVVDLVPLDESWSGPATDAERAAAVQVGACAAAWLVWKSSWRPGSDLG